MKRRGITRNGTHASRALLCLGAAAGYAALTACGPNYSAVADRLRKENIELRSDLGAARDELKNKEATIRDLQGKEPRLPTLPPERLAQVFTAVRLEVAGQTDAQELAGGARGFRIFLRAYTKDAQTIPATGALTLEAFELPAAPAEPRRIGTWKFTAEEMKKNWYSGLGAYHFAFSCPFQTAPTMTNVTFKARLVDALTGQTLEAQLEKKITPVDELGKK